MKKESVLLIKRSAKRFSGPAAKSRGLGLGLPLLKIRREAGMKEIRASKLLRACGGCLGAKRR